MHFTQKLVEVTLHFDQIVIPNIEIDDTRCIQLENESLGEPSVDFLYMYKQQFEILILICTMSK